MEAGSEEDIFPGTPEPCFPRTPMPTEQRKLQLVSQCHITMAACGGWGWGRQPRLGAFFESVSLLGMIWPVSFSRVPTYSGGSSLGSRASLCIPRPLLVPLQGKVRRGGEGCAAPIRTLVLDFVLQPAASAGHLPGAWDSGPVWRVWEVSPAPQTFWTAGWRTQRARWKGSF